MTARFHLQNLHLSLATGGLGLGGAVELDSLVLLEDSCLLFQQVMPKSQLQNLLLWPDVLGLGMGLVVVVAG